MQRWLFGRRTFFVRSTARNKLIAVTYVATARSLEATVFPDIDRSVVVQLLRMLHDYVRSIVRSIVRPHESIHTTVVRHRTFGRVSQSVVHHCMTVVQTPLWPTTMKRVVASHFWSLNSLKICHDLFARTFTHKTTCKTSAIDREILPWDHHNFAGHSLSQTAVW